MPRPADAGSDRRAAAEQVAGKAGGLIRLREAGFRVPEFEILKSHAASPTSVMFFEAGGVDSHWKTSPADLPATIARLFTMARVDMASVPPGPSLAAILAAVISSGGPILLSSSTMFVNDWLPFSKDLSSHSRLRAYRSKQDSGDNPQQAARE